MGTIIIHPPIEIFDHPDYCFVYDLSGQHECQWIADLNYCELFDVDDMETESKPIRTLKCPQCREYYQKEKDRQNKLIVSQRLDKKTGCLHFIQTTAGEEEEYLKKGLASADKFIDKMEKVAPSVLGDEDQ